MIRVAHVFDEHAGWEHRQAYGQLRSRSNPRTLSHFPVAISPGVPPRYELDRTFIRVSKFGRGPISVLTTAPVLQRFALRNAIDVIVAWGTGPAWASVGGPQSALVVALFEADLSARRCTMLRILSRRERFAVVCGNATLRRRLVEHGVPAERCVVIRPGVDFGLIGRNRRVTTRNRLGLTEGHRVWLVGAPVTRAGGQFEVYWAAKLASSLDPDLRLVVPGESPEGERIARFSATLPPPNILIRPPGELPFEELFPAADLFAQAPDGEGSTTALAWAMGAGVPIVAAATYSVTELIANKLNGLLFKGRRGECRALPIVRLARQEEDLARAAETARGQAYEVFGVQRFVDQHTKLYQNVFNGVSAAEGIVDSALAG